MKFEEIESDLILEALKGNFDVIGHCCNCFCTMGAGIAVPMSKTFGVDKFKMEGKKYSGNINKLGTIDYNNFFLVKDTHDVIIPIKSNFGSNTENHPELTVVNMYGQFGFGGKFGNSKKGVPFDIEAFTKCLNEINITFKGQHIGLPKFIGCGLAGGNWIEVEKLIKKELIDCDVTLVYLPIKK